VTGGATTSWPAGYLRLSEAYDGEAARARSLGWPVIEQASHHLGLLTDPGLVADSLLEAAHWANTHHPESAEIVSKITKVPVTAIERIEAALRSADAGWANVVQFTTYLVHSQDIAKFMSFRLREFPRMFPSGAFPPNTLLVIDRLVAEPFLVEVQTVAAL